MATCPKCGNDKLPKNADKRFVCKRHGPLGKPATPGADND